MSLDPSGIPSRAEIQKAIDEGVASAIASFSTFVPGGWEWGVEFNPATHKPKEYKGTVDIAVTAGTGTLLSDLSTHFKGVSMILTGPANAAAVGRVEHSLSSSTVLVAAYDNANSLITGTVRVNFLMAGWN